MVLEDLALGIGGNIATNILQFHAESLRGTRVGKILQSQGLLGKDFGDQLKDITVSAISNIYAIKPAYKLKSIANFLSGTVATQEISDYILEGDPIDKEVMRKELERFLDPVARDGQLVWPRSIDPDNLIDDLLKSIDLAIAKSSHPALSAAHSQSRAAHNKITLIQEELTGLRADLKSIFDLSHLQYAADSWKKFETKFNNHIHGRFGRMTTPGARDLHGVKQ